MVGYIKKSAGGDFKPTPAGQHLMVCSRVIDLGTQPGSQKFPTPRRKIRIAWELPEERIKFNDDRGFERDLPTIHQQTFTASFHEKANLRKLLEGWRGKKFVDEDFAGPPSGFHLGNLIGIPAYGQIVHTENDGTTYANLNAIMKPPQAVMNEKKGAIEGDRIFFDLDDFQRSEFEKLHEKLQETIMSSPEYQTLFGAAPTPSASGFGTAATPPASGAQPFGLDDEIPF